MSLCRRTGVTQEHEVRFIMSPQYTQRLLVGRISVILNSVALEASKLATLRSIERLQPQIG